MRSNSRIVSFQHRSQSNLCEAGGRHHPCPISQAGGASQLLQKGGTTVTTTFECGIKLKESPFPRYFITDLVHEDVKISQIPFFPLKLCPRFHKNSTQNFFFATHLNALLIVVGHHSNALMSDADVGCDAIFVHTISSLYNLEKTTIMPIMTTLFDPPDKIYVSQTNWTPGQFFVPFFIISTTSNWLL